MSGIQVVLDLVAQVAADHVEQRAALDVGRAESWRTYQPPRDSSSTSSWLNVYVWSGKWPQKMIAFDHTLRTMFAVKLALRVALNDSPLERGQRDLTETSPPGGSAARAHASRLLARLARQLGAAPRGRPSTAPLATALISGHAM